MYDISILFAVKSSDVNAIEIELRQFIRRFAGSLIVKLQEIIFLRSEYNNCYNRIYRLWWQSVTIPLSRETCNTLQHELRQRLIKEFSNDRLQRMILS